MLPLCQWHQLACCYYLFSEKQSLKPELVFIRRSPKNPLNHNYDSWHVAINSSVKSTVHSDVVHSVDVHDMGVRTMGVHRVGMHGVGMLGGGHTLRGCELVRVLCIACINVTNLMQ